MLAQIWTKMNVQLSLSLSSILARTFQPSIIQGGRVLIRERYICKYTDVG